jgi:two-component system response regulator TtrR
MVKGEVTKIIAKNLNISLNTVELHRSRVMKKMKVSSLAELVQLVILNSPSLNTSKVF